MGLIVVFVVRIIKVQNIDRKMIIFKKLYQNDTKIHRMNVINGMQYAVC